MDFTNFKAMLDRLFLNLESNLYKAYETGDIEESKAAVKEMYRILILKEHMANVTEEEYIRANALEVDLSELEYFNQTFSDIGMPIYNRSKLKIHKKEK